MPTYRVTFRVHPGVRRLVLDVEADEYELQLHGGWHVLWCYALVVDRPRRIVVLRAPGVAVARVERRCRRRAI